MNVFLAPASSENLLATIKRRVPFSEVRHLMDARDLRAIKDLGNEDEGFHCWAVTENRKNIWDKMKNEDIVLFKETGTGYFTCVGKIFYKSKSDKNKKLAAMLWKYGTGWHYIYFLKSIKAIQIPYRKLMHEVGYTNPRDILPGIRQIKPTAMEEINLKHGSFEKLLEKPNRDLSFA